MPAPKSRSKPKAQIRHEEPQGEIEAGLASFWKQLLRKKKIGRHDNFFDIGGHSLMAAQLGLKVQQQFGVTLDLVALFDNPTIAGIGAYMESLIGKPQQPMRRADRSLPLQPSLAQQRLWFIDQMGGENASYFDIAVLTLRGDLNVAALRSALDTIVQRHEVLRTSFVNEGGKPRLHFHSDWRFPLQETDYPGAVSRDNALHVALHEERETGFDLAGKPLLRGHLLRFAADDHLLLITMHHIITDAWSVGVFIRELSELYGAYSERRGDPLPPLQFQYADYAQWQRESLQGEVLAEHVAFWQQRLAEAPSLLTLPGDRARPAVSSHRGADMAFEIDAELTTALKQLARDTDTTLYMVLYAGLALLLSRLSSQHDLVIGTPVANRQRAEVEGLIGFFVNMLPMRIRIDAAENVETLLRRVREMALATFSHQELPFEQIVEIAQPPRTLNHSPVFQVIFGLENTPVEPFRLPGLQIEKTEPTSATAHVDLSVALRETDGCLRGRFNYSTDLFDSGTIANWQAWLLNVLRAMTTQSHKQLHALAWLSEGERQRVLYEFNRTEREIAWNTFVFRLFEQQVTKNPGAIAVMDGERTLGYAALNARANAVARRLGELGVRPDDRVVAFLDRSSELVCALLGILKAGATYVPLETADPANRTQYLLDDAAPKGILTTRVLSAKLPDTSCPVVCVDTLFDAVVPETPTDEAFTVDLSPANLAYIIYTSGTTGVPKGVMVEHHSLLNYIDWRMGFAGTGRGEVFLLQAPVNFDRSITEMLSALCAGGTLVIATPHAQYDVEYICALIQRHRITRIALVPSVLEALLPHLHQCDSLRSIASGGEALPLNLVQEFYARNRGSCQLYNVYGPTETTCIVSSYHCSADAKSASVPIGKPIPNVRFYVLDEYLNPLPPGVAGELFIGGSCVARGYLNRPELTAEKFIVNPFSSDPGYKNPFSSDPNDRLYRSGDLVRWRVDGNIEFLGRRDDQVKVRGIRIELQEIENTIDRHEAVARSVVVVQGKQQGAPQLVAYYVAADGELNVNDLRQYLQQQLPDFMVPHALMKLDAMPLTPNGKVDRKALPKPELDAFTDKPFEAPAGSVEEALAQLWRELLSLDRIGRHDNFFALGGHSLLAAQLTAMIHKRLGLNLELAALFGDPTIAGISKHLGELAHTPLQPITLADRTQPLLPSLAQQRLWFIDQMGGENSSYFGSLVLALHGQLDQAALQAALDAVVQRHEALRTNFVSDDGKPHLLIHAERKFQLQHIDCTKHSISARQPIIEEVLQQERAARFDLERGALLRGRLLRFTARAHVLVITMHHIITDAWSTGIFVREVSAVYRASTEGGSDPMLPPLELQYADYAQWQRAWLQGEVLQSHVAFWKQHLAGVSPLLTLPTDHPRPALPSYRGTGLSFTIDAALTAKLKALARSSDCTLYMVLYAGFAIMLSRLSGQRDIVVGTPVANRQRAEVENLIGFFVNMLPMRIQLDEEESVDTLLQRVKKMALATFSHQELPFEQIVEIAQPSRSLNYSPVFQVVLALQNAPVGSFSLPGLEVEVMQSDGRPAHVDLSLALTEKHGCLDAWLNYATDLFDESTITRWVSCFVTVLEGIVTQVAEPIRALSLVSGSQREQLLQVFNDTAHEYPRDRLVMELFEDRVSDDPGAIALISEDRELSYPALNAEADKVARQLRALGVGADDLVCVYLERSVELVCALLGALKAGACYVPLDTAYPETRISYLLDDAAPKAILTIGALAQKLPPTGIDVIYLDALDASNVVDTTPLPQTSLHDLAYIIYTSGTTGVPKGVMIEHGTLLNYVHWRNRFAGIATDDVFLFKAPVNFDLSVAEMLIPLTAGAKLVIAKPNAQYDIQYLRQLVLRHGISRLSLVPSMLEAMLPHLPEFTALRSVTSGGDAIAASLTKAFHAQAPVGCQLFNMYGPSETTCIVSSYRCSPDETAATVPIGKPIPNVYFRVLDEHLNLLPPGVNGELFIGGNCLARGYLNRPDLTAEKFIIDPFSSDPNGRLYRSGDLVRWRGDGNIEFMGRVDHQVKIRGVRIELEEIENNLNRQRGIRSAVVAVVGDEDSARQLVAYYVVDHDAVSVTELRERLKAVLPEYMVPQAFVALTALPLTSNGKVDRKALPKPDADSYVRSPFEAPRGEAEESLAAIWRELLAVDRVGRHDNFFDLGGHSLLAAQLVALMQKKVGIKLSLSLFFKTPTIAEIAALASGANQDTGHAVVLRAGPGDHPLFCIHELSGSSVVYQQLGANMPGNGAVLGIECHYSEIKSLSSIAEIAAVHVRTIRSIQQSGPYQLLGWSMGGLIACEIARQLIQQGGEVTLLALVDTHLPKQKTTATEKRHDLEELKTFLMKFGAPADALQSLQNPDAIDIDVLSEHCSDQVLLILHLLTLARQHHPQLAGLDIDLFSAAMDEKALSRWQAATTRLRIHQVGGTHHTILQQPHLSHLLHLLNGVR